MRPIDDGSERNFLNNRCEWPIKSCDLPIMSARPNNANDRKSACAIDERLSRHLPFVQPLAAGGQLVGLGRKARRDKPGRKGTLQHAGTNKVVPRLLQLKLDRRRCSIGHDGAQPDTSWPSPGPSNLTPAGRGAFQLVRVKKPRLGRGEVSPSRGEQTHRLHDGSR
jgi:hypothetical protein